jgi:hypothetical protein
MPAIDQCHEQVVHALEKDGWRVEPKSFPLPIAVGRTFWIDIEAQQLAQFGLRTILLVEVKCFPSGRSETTELYTSLGQYLVYRSLLRQQGFNADLYLAVPTFAFEGIFAQIGMSAVIENEIKMVVIDIEREVIVQWQ